MFYGIALSSSSSYINMNQPYVYICPLSLQLLFHLPLHPTSLACQRALFELAASCSKFPLAIYFTHGYIHVSMLPSQFVPPFPSPTVSTNLFPMSVSPLLPCIRVHRYHLSRFHIYALIYIICFSLSDLLHSL